eukprot:gnl/Spiro4/2639_TR1278_c0_g1_i2.p1 gnl/Spiro4/2639_TR1278_c0_g1~~gnl/Spiro4/2639_TR1278_c0_g1_i2.p1  ORF type:complete len:210 (-),score=41.14 gnl/Spiro4/2639_TR1278_c0_g1_i2:103-732(-)
MAQPAPLLTPQTAAGLAPSDSSTATAQPRSPAVASPPSVETQRRMSMEAARLAAQARPDLVLRPLQLGDYDRGFVELLSQLTVVAPLSRAEFEARFREMAACPEHYFVMVIEDTQKRVLCAAGTVFVERKFVHSAGLVGHIEDIVVSSDYRSAQLGRRILEALIAISHDRGCYKVILDCEVKNVEFYSRLGFSRPKEQVEMSVYFQSKL